MIFWFTAVWFIVLALYDGCYKFGAPEFDGFSGFYEKCYDRGIFD
jgi:hypothetical protein